jgi:drug/metabolite transporter (DMT)-like permease
MLGSSPCGTLRALSCAWSSTGLLHERTSRLLKAAVIGTIIVLSRRVVDPVAPDPKRPFDTMGAILSAVGMFFVVFGILQAGHNNTLLVIFLVAGVACLLGFFLYSLIEEEQPNAAAGFSCCASGAGSLGG